MQNQPIGTTRERVDFSRIRTSVPIPNLIEVQKKSYERFLQMDLLPDERDDTGLQSVFKSVFPISDFRGLSELAFVDYAIGNWECKCGSLKGLNHLRTVCRNPSCGAGKGRRRTARQRRTRARQPYSPDARRAV